MQDLIPKLYDEVKHKKNDVSGTVIAVYRKTIATGLIEVLDVRDGDKIYYATLIENWTVTVPYAKYEA